MRDYGTVHTAIWTDPKIRSGSEDAKWLFVYCLTSPHSNSVGAFLLPDAYIADDLDWASQRVRKAMDELKRAGLVERFQDGRHVVIVNFLRWNPPENPNTGKGLVKVGMKLPISDPAMRHVLNALDEILAEAKPDAKGEVWQKTVLEPFAKAIRTQLEQRSNGVRNGSGNLSGQRSHGVSTEFEQRQDSVRTIEPEPEPEQEPDQEQDPEPEPESSPLRGAVIAASDFDRWWEAYPLKKEKLAAKKAYEGVLKKQLATQDELLTGAVAYAEAMANTEPKFIKHATTWLSKGCWADEITTNHQSRTGIDSVMAGIGAILGAADE